MYRSRWLSCGRNCHCAVGVFLRLSCGNVPRAIRNINGFSVDEAVLLRRVPKLPVRVRPSMLRLLHRQHGRPDQQLSLGSVLQHHHVCPLWWRLLLHYGQLHSEQMRAHVSLHHCKRSLLEFPLLSISLALISTLTIDLSPIPPIAEPLCGDGSDG
jgi:hypothetical protein